MNTKTIRFFIFSLIAIFTIQCSLIISVFFLVAKDNKTELRVSFRKHFLQFYFSPIEKMTKDDEDKFKQIKSNTCGPAALAFLLNQYGVAVDQNKLELLAETSKDGTSLKGIIKAAKSFGVKSWGERQNFQGLIISPKPLIAHINNNHFVVVKSANQKNVEIFDPGYGYSNIPARIFVNHWTGYVAIVDLFDPIHSR